MTIKDIFPTVQGEGVLAGAPCTFIRTSGCSVACHFCDTDWKRGQAWEMEDLVNFLKYQPYLKHFVITGGEPFDQKHLYKFIHRLYQVFKSSLIQVETSCKHLAKVNFCERYMGITNDYFPEDINLHFTCSPKLFYPDFIEIALATYISVKDIGFVEFKIVIEETNRNTIGSLVNLANVIPDDVPMSIMLEDSFSLEQDVALTLQFLFADDVIADRYFLSSRLQNLYKIK